jgi:hypothetical protein
VVLAIAGVIREFEDGQHVGTVDKIEGDPPCRNNPVEP